MKCDVSCSFHENPDKNVRRKKIDPLLKDLIKELNHKGFKTQYSCQGNSEEYSYIIFAKQKDAKTILGLFEKVFKQLGCENIFWVKIDNCLTPGYKNSSTKTFRVLKWEKTLTYDQDAWYRFQQKIFELLRS